MKLVVLRNKLLEALSVVDRAIGENSNLPILKCVYIRTDDNKIVFTTTNLELAITYISSGKIIENGEVAIPLHLFSTIIKNITSERITLESKGKKLFIETDNYEAFVQTQEIKEFPIIPSIHNKTQSLQINSKTLVETIESVIVATQYSEIRPEISGVFVGVEEYGMVCAGTDSFRLAEKRVDAGFIKSTFVEPVKCIIPLKTSEEILKILHNQEEGEVFVFIDPTQILFKTQSTEIISRLIDGNFPDYQPIIPKQTHTEAIIPRQEFLNAIRLTSSFSGRGNDITLTVGENKKYIELFSSDNALGENRCKVPIHLKGERFTLVFNWKYLSDGFKIFKSDELIIGVTTSDRPVIIKNQTDPSLIYVAMPIKN
ncbi:MAG: DNA polymerase III subunit beta [Patescibacteria group bacterium]